MSRAEWLAYGGSAVALLGCTNTGILGSSHPDASAVADATEEAATPLADDESPVADATEEPASDLADAATPIVDAMEIPPEARGDLGFLCVSRVHPDAGTLCDKASEWCFTNHNFEPTGCVSLASTCIPPAAGTCSNAFYWDASACVPGTPRCACLTVTCNEGWCADGVEGGITVSCGSCYGAPPVRLAAPDLVS
jgi:hypothetical protein